MRAAVVYKSALRTYAMRRYERRAVRGARAAQCVRVWYARRVRVRCAAQQASSLYPGIAENLRSGPERFNQVIHPDPITPIDGSTNKKLMTGDQLIPIRSAGTDKLTRVDRD